MIEKEKTKKEYENELANLEKEYESELEEAVAIMNSTFIDKLKNETLFLEQ